LRSQDEAAIDADVQRLGRAALALVEQERDRLRSLSEIGDRDPERVLGRPAAGLASDGGPDFLLFFEREALADELANRLRRVGRELVELGVDLLPQVGDRQCLRFG
jgi:hypothetical protein